MAERPHWDMFESCQQHAYEMAAEAEALLRARPPGQSAVECANALAHVGRLWAEMARNELWADRSEGERTSDIPQELLGEHPVGRHGRR